MHITLQSFNVHGANITHGTGGVVEGVDRVVSGQRTKTGFALAEGARQLDLPV